MNKWTKTNNFTVEHHTPIFDVVKQPMKTPAGKDFNAVKIKCQDWITAVILNKDTNKIVLVKEFRHGIDRYVYEFPSGTHEDGEDIEVTCIREVQEETGYKNVKILKKLYTASPNPAFMMNTANSFLVEVSGEKEQQHLDADEFVTVEEKSIEEVENLIMSPEDTGAMQKLSWTLAKTYIIK